MRRDAAARARAAKVASNGVATQNGVIHPQVAAEPVDQ
jgi:hypothetical protein